MIKTAEELQAYSGSEERKLEEIISGLAGAGPKVVVSGAAIGEMAMHFIEKYGMMAIRWEPPPAIPLGRVHCVAATGWHLGGITGGCDNM